MRKEIQRKKVLVGMSGGVDSSVSAALLLEQGYEVVGAFMKNWSDEKFEGCQWRTDRRDAMRVASKLGIPFVTLDFEKEYRSDVVEYMFDEIKKGRTPNPDVMCNRYIKFKRFVEAADKLGCEYIATGHYARISDTCGLLSGVDPEKDQTYFLWGIKPEILSKVIFPVGNMLKSQVRAKARELGLATAAKKDSTGICFVGEIDLVEFIKERIPEDPGEIVTTQKKVIGTHKGVHFYTVGQRHGLDVGGGVPYYVVDKDIKNRRLIVASNYHQDLFFDVIHASDANWFCMVQNETSCLARIRYRQELQECNISKVDGDKVTVEFTTPQRAVTPGQSIVFYDNDVVLGGAIIDFGEKKKPKERTSTVSTFGNLE